MNCQGASTHDQNESSPFSTNANEFNAPVEGDLKSRALEQTNVSAMKQILNIFLKLLRLTELILNYFLGNRRNTQTLTKIFIVIPLQHQKIVSWLYMN